MDLRTMDPVPLKAPGPFRMSGLSPAPRSFMGQAFAGRDSHLVYGECAGDRAQEDCGNVLEVTELQSCRTSSG
jgi:hypothetical protein